MVIAAFFRDESCGQCVPCRVGTVRQEEAIARLLSGRTCGTVEDELALIGEIGVAMRDASICGLGQTASAAIESAIAWGCSTEGTQMIELPIVPTQPPPRLVGLTIDEQQVEVPEGSTVLDACAKLGIDTPTLCYGKTLTPSNVCRICVVEMEGGRALVPACSRKVEPDMVIRTDSDRVRHSRKMVIEFLASSVDLSITPAAQAYMQRYDAHPERYGPPAPPDTERDHKRTGHHERPDGQTAATVHAPTKVDNDLYVRDYSKCILCYKCVDACGDQYQNTFAITVAGRGFDARISTEYANPLPESACVYCGNCIAVCPTGALMFRSEHELRETGGLGREAPDADRHDLPLLRRGLQPHSARAGQRDRQGHLPRRPRHHAREPLHQGPLRFPARSPQA